MNKNVQKSFKSVWISADPNGSKTCREKYQTSNNINLIKYKTLLQENNNNDPIQKKKECTAERNV